MKYEQEVRENGETHKKGCNWEKCSGCGGGRISPEKREKYRLLRLQLKRDMKLKQLGIQSKTEKE